MDISTFIARWAKTASAERANAQSYLNDLCDVLKVPRPDGATGDPARDTYVFECPAYLPRPGQRRAIGRMDLYKAGAFVLEAKQGARADSRPTGSAKRGTPAWNVAMKDAFGQALGYACALDAPPPFLIVADVGHCFDLYAAFDGTTNYRPFPNAQAHRIFMADLDTPKSEHAKTLRAVWTDPMSLDPARKAARVTREVAGHLAELARSLEAAGHPADAVAGFLMRCIFTMFAEDVGLLPKDIFRDAIKDHWIKRPETFVDGVAELWRKMNTGGHFGAASKLLRFNGGLFRDAEVLPLAREQLEVMLTAARCDWQDVEPAIFGTLLERALDPKERHRLGAHYTPRAYVERLVQPTIEEPLREEWDAVRVEVRRLVGDDFAAGAGRLKASQRTRVNAARQLLRKFHHRLCNTHVLDPACGTGNFLYVAMEFMKRLEGEVVAMLNQLGAQGDALHLESVTVTPAQFLGIEKKRWAKEIATLVLWIGFLQWHARTYRNADGSVHWIEPVLRDLDNIQCRDALIDWKSVKGLVDDKGRKVLRAANVTDKKAEREMVQVEHYKGVSVAPWPEAEFLIGNPPFLGNKRMSDLLGAGYVEAIKEAYPEVNGSADLVMWWWWRCAEQVATGKARRFGLVTTNSITQTFDRAVVARALSGGSVRLIYAVPDHPWYDEGAAVRIAMTVGARNTGADGKPLAAPPPALLCRAVEGGRASAPEDVRVETRPVAEIHADLSAGANVLAAVPLLANERICYQGMNLVGEGFRLSPEELRDLGVEADGRPPVVHPYVIGRDLVQVREERYVIDFYGLDADTARKMYPSLWNHVVREVRPAREKNNRDNYRKFWWLFGEGRPGMRRALAGLDRFIATGETARHRVFQFLDAATVPDHKVYAIASSDAHLLGVLSSRVHVTWALAAGGRLGVGNDSTWTSSTCFAKFPFPAAAAKQRAAIGKLASAIDQHRKACQKRHVRLALTDVYNVLAKVRAGAPLSPVEEDVRKRGLLDTLRQLHDDLDAAVLDAYGWPSEVSDAEILDRLVRLNAERAKEEAKGHVRWLRPEFQDPNYVQAADPAKAPPRPKAVKAAAPPRVLWPEERWEQLVALREALRSHGEPATLNDVMLSFNRAKRNDVEELLKGMEFLGLAVPLGDQGDARWTASRRS